MNTISFTPAQMIAGFLAICAGIVTIGKAFDWIEKTIVKARKPQTAQDDRLTELERRTDMCQQYLNSDKHRLDALEEGNRVTQRAILALLQHAIDGNDIDGLKEAHDELTDYLIRR